MLLSNCNAFSTKRRFYFVQLNFLRSILGRRLFKLVVNPSGNSDGVAGGVRADARVRLAR